MLVSTRATVLSRVPDKPRVAIDPSRIDERLAVNENQRNGFPVLEIR